MKQKAHQEVVAIGALGTPAFIAQACAPLLRSNEDINRQCNKLDKCSNQHDTPRQKYTLTKKDFRWTRNYPRKLVDHYYDETNIVKDKGVRVRQQSKSRYNRESNCNDKRTMHCYQYSHCYSYTLDHQCKSKMKWCCGHCDMPQLHCKPLSGGLS